MLTGLAAVLAAYLVGSIASAIVVSRAMGLQDPRSVGSGNPGATNVLRHSGRKAAAFTLGGDVLKGLLPLLVARAAGAGETLLAIMGAAAFIGHLYPIFFGFKGGKGVATFIGVLLGLAWPLAAIFCGAWIAIAAAFRYSSLAGLVATAMMPPAALALGVSRPCLAAVVLMSALIFWRHRSNIRNLMQGRESKIGERSDPT